MQSEIYFQNFNGRRGGQNLWDNNSIVSNHNQNNVHPPYILPKLYGMVSRIDVQASSNLREDFIHGFSVKA